MVMVVMSDVTQILQQIEVGDPSAAEQLLPLVYDELRKLASAKMSHEMADHSLQATALVHEAYLRLVDTDRVQRWDSRRHFFAAAAEAMRRILIESARRRAQPRRGAGMTRIELEVMASNATAVRLYEQLGFVHEGVKRRARHLDGAWDDNVLMALLAS